MTATTPPLGSSHCRVSRRLWLIASTIGAVGLAIAPAALAEEWQFFAAGTDSYRHYIDLESLQWDADDPAIASARFSSNQQGEVYLMTHYCDPASPHYGTYLLDGYRYPLRLETVVESARSILCLGPCPQFAPPRRYLCPGTRHPIGQRVLGSLCLPHQPPLMEILAWMGILAAMEIATLIAAQLLLR